MAFVCNHLMDSECVGVLLNCFQDNKTIVNGVEVQPTVSLTAHVLAALSVVKGITGVSYDSRASRG